MKLSNKVYYLFAIALQGLSLILELLPIGAVMVLAPSPIERTIEIYSYFSLIFVGNAYFIPILTGVFTIAAMLFGILSLIKFEKASKNKKTSLVCSIITLLFSLTPLLLFGNIGMTTASYAISTAMILSIFLQAVATRQT